MQNENGHHCLSQALLDPEALACSRMTFVCHSKVANTAYTVKHVQLSLSAPAAAHTTVLHLKHAHEMTTVKQVDTWLA